MEFGSVTTMRCKYLEESVVVYHSVRKPGFVYKFAVQKGILHIGVVDAVN
jgi:hypothetical protein